MGLDMFLYRKIYVGANYPFNEVTGVIDISKQGEKLKVDLNKVVYIVENVGYWRKANQIHGWFVDNVQDGEDNCAEYYVSGEKLKELYELCKDVLKHHTKKYAEEHLPACEGFFFGDYKYDKWYFQDLKDTIDIIDEIMKDDPNLEGDYSYQSSW